MYHEIMKWLVPMLFLTLASGADLSKIQNVYLMPMSSGLDQYLANRLTAGGVLQVVTDPAKADAIFTDRLGDAFDKRLDELFPPAKPELKESKTDREKEKEAAEQTWQRPAGQSFTKGRGNLFLVDRQTRNVIWSIYERPKSGQPDQLHKTASRVAERFQKDRSGK